MNRTWLILVLAALSMLGALSIDAYLPAMPAIAKTFTATIPAVQQTLTIYLAAFAFMTLFYGTLSDSFGRRPVILAALVLYLFSSIGASLAPSLGWLMFFRLCQGLCAGAGSVIGRAIIGDSLKGPEAQRAMSYVSVVFSLAPAVAPIVGGWLLAHSGWRTIFYSISAFTLVLLIACIFGLPESLPRAQRQPFHFGDIVTNYRRVACHVEFMFGALAIAFCFAGVMIYVASAPAYVMDMLHLSETEFGWLFVPIVGGLMLGSWCAGLWSHRFSPGMIIGIGYAAMVVATAWNVAYSLLYSIALPWAVMPIFVYTFGASLASPPMTVLTLELFPTVRGLAASLQSFSFLIIFSVGSGVLCPYLMRSSLYLALGAAGGLVISGLFWWISRRAAQHAAIEEEMELEQG